jgi:dTDP-4-amino-4,6-dideoxygalactose transaminase
VEKDHEVIVPTLTFIASVNPVKYLHAHPVFMDCDDSLCMDMGKLKEFCKTECDFIGNKLVNKSTGKHIKAVVVVHVFGNMADMPAVMDIAKEYNLKVIEDVSHAQGGYYKGKKLGTFGDVAAMSLMSGKSFACGEIGMLVTDDRELYERAMAYSHYERNNENYIQEFAEFPEIGLHWAASERATQPRVSGELGSSREEARRRGDPIECSHLLSIHGVLHHLKTRRFDLHQLTAIREARSPDRGDHRAAWRWLRGHVQGCVESPHGG